MSEFSLPERPLKWAEFQAFLRSAMATQPRGYQSRLARELKVTPGYVHQLVAGLRAIPPEALPVVLSSLELDYGVTVYFKKE